VLRHLPRLHRGGARRRVPGAGRLAGGALRGGAGCPVHARPAERHADRAAPGRGVRGDAGDVHEGCGARLLRGGERAGDPMREASSGALADVDEMVSACAAAGKIFGAGNTQRCIPELQELAARVHAGTYGQIRSATLHGFGGEIVGGGVQALSVLRLLTGAEVTQVNAYSGVMGEEAEQMRAEAIAGGHPQPFDSGLQYSATLTLDTGLVVPCFPVKTSCGGVDVRPSLQHALHCMEAQASSIQLQLY
jgi:hypothetical protein